MGKAEGQSKIGSATDLGTVIDRLTSILATPLPVEDTGTNTNPEQYKVDHSFRSQVVAMAGGVATPLWTITTGRTAGLSTYIYWIQIYNPTAGAVTGWLEIAGTVLVTIHYALAAGQTLALSLPTVSPMGDNNILCNASANTVEFQIGGYEI